MDDSVHTAQLLMHLGGNVLSLDRACCVPRQAQCPVHGGALFGAVDRLTGKQPPDPVIQFALSRQLEQVRQGLPGQTLLGVIEQQRPPFAVQLIETLRIARKQLCQMLFLHGVGVVRQNAPDHILSFIKYFKSHFSECSPPDTPQRRPIP